MPHYAIVTSNGELVSEASVISPEAIEARGLTAYEVDGPRDGRPWDNANKAWGTRVADRGPRTLRARTAFAAATTDSQRIEALAIALGVKD